MKSPKEPIAPATGKFLEKVINLTPWRIILESSNNGLSEVILEIPPATKEASLASNMIKSSLTINDTLTVTIFDATETVIVGLPPQVEDRYLVVTPIILEALKGNREDCLAPCIFGSYGTLEMVGGLFIARTVGFLRGSFSQ